MTTTQVLIGNAPLTIAKASDGRSVYIYRGRPAPDDLLDTEVERLVAEGYLTHVEIYDDDEALAIVTGVVDPDGVTPPPSVLSRIDDILLEVGGDPAKAEAYLQLEMDKARPRPKLVTQLEAVIDDAEAADDQGDPDSPDGVPPAQDQGDQAPAEGQGADGAPVIAPVIP